MSRAGRRVGLVTTVSYSRRADGTLTVSGKDDGKG